MEFGLFMELSVPRPWSADSERQSYENALEQVRLADELGFDYVWAVEHHFLEEYSHSSAPDLFLTACAMQTKRIRVGHGVVACVPQYQSPIRIAERAAALDILSGGRVELGTGRSATWTELGGFRANADETKKTWDEFVRVIPKMWMQERFSWQGRCFSMPERGGAAQARAEAAPADVGRGHVSRNRARRRRPWPGVSRPRARRLLRVGEEGQVVPGASPELRSRRVASSTTRSRRSTSSRARRTAIGRARRGSASPASSATWRRSCCRRRKCCPPARTRRPACSRRCGGRPAGPATPRRASRASRWARPTTWRTRSASGKRSATTASTSSRTSWRCCRSSTCSTACACSPST